MITSLLRNTFTLLITAWLITACSESSRPVKKQVATDNSKGMLKHSLPKETAKPGEYLASLLKNNVSLKDTLVVLDLDDTLITSPEGQWLGRSEMFYDYLNKERAEFPEKTKKQLADAIDPLLVEVYKRVPVALTDLSIPDVINQYKKQGALVIGMTARGTILLDTTMQQLTEAGVAFSDISAKKPVPIDEKRTMFFQSGVAMVSHGNTKGEALETLVKSGYLPEHYSQIIMIDDKQEHLDNVAETVKKLGNGQITYIPALCLYPQVSAKYNSAEAAEQLEVFLTNWRNDAVIADLIRNDYFTRKFLKQCASGNSKQKEQCQLLLNND